MATDFIREDHFLTNDFGSIFVPTTINYTPTEDTGFAYADGSTGTINVLDLSSVGNAVLGLVDVSEQIGYLGTLHTSEQEISPEYNAYKELVSSNLYFLWGSFKKGGFYFRRSHNNIIMGLFEGFFQYTEGVNVGLLQYMFNESSVPLTKTTMSQIGLSYYGDASDFDTRPSFQVFYKNDNITGGYWDVDTYEYQEAVYEYYINPNLAVLTQDYTWTDDFSFDFNIPPFSFQPVPCRPWTIGTNVSPMVFFTHDTTGAIVIGSWDGGAKIQDPSAGGGSTGGGGGGKFPNKNTPIGFANPEGMTIDATTSGFVTIFNPTVNEMRAFNNYLFSNDITEAISNQMKRLIANPYDYIINAALIHFVPSKKDYKTLIKFCGFDSHVSSYEVSSEYQRVGPYTMELAPQFNSFLDYNPYSKAKLYLPYIGIVDINIDDINGSKNNNSVISLVYHVDLLSGGCVAEMMVTRGRRVNSANADNPIANVQQSWTGNIFSKIPISTNDFSSLMNATLQFASGGVSALTGNPIGGLGAMASAVMSGKGSVQKSTSNTSNYGYINQQEPYLIIESPIQSYPEYLAGYNYDSYLGIPSNIMNTVSYFSGYLETDEKTMWGTDISYTYGTTTINAFDEEIEEIKRLFESGVYVNV